MEFTLFHGAFYPYPMIKTDCRGFGEVAFLGGGWINSFSTE
jgi:hypothetical protein